MSIFDPITLGWDGKTYTVPARNVLEAIARIEEHITLTDLLRSRGGSIPLAKLSRAYASVLRAAGATDITDEAVYRGMFAETVGAVNNVQMITDVVGGLLHMMIPKDQETGLAPVVPTGAAKPGNSPRATRRPRR